mgnify:CR=1 FL=1
MMLNIGYAPGAVFETLREAMAHYDAAIALAPHDNPDAALRWNTCVRMIERAGLEPAGETHAGLEHFDDEVPWRAGG